MKEKQTEAIFYEFRITEFSIKDGHSVCVCIQYFICCYNLSETIFSRSVVVNNDTYVFSCDCNKLIQFSKPSTMVI